MGQNHKPNLYLYIQKRLLESADEENTISYKEAEKILLNIRISKSFVPVLIKEMNHLGLTKRISYSKVELINPKSSKKIIVDWKYGKRRVRCY